MFIKKDNLTIRNATNNDAELLARWWNDGRIMEHAGYPNGLNTNVDEIKQKLATDSDDTRRRLIIELNNVSIGEMNFTNAGEKVAEIGIKICDFSKREQGIGTKVLSMLINHIFNDLGYQKIKLDTNLNNLRAQHVYEKLGFVKIKVNLDSWKDQLGNLQSSIDYELNLENFVNYAK